MNKTWRQQIQAFGILAGACTAALPAAAADGRLSPATPDGSYQVADLFGESEEEKAARLQQMQHEQAQDSSINYWRQRSQDLENTVRHLTGQIEQLDHRIDEANTRIERMQKDFDYRLCKVAATQLGASDEAPVPCMGTGPQASFAPPASTPADTIGSPPPRGTGEPMQLAPPPGRLGTLPANGGPSAQAGATPPPSTNRARFDAAMTLLGKTQYDEARGAFRSFADAYPSDELAPQAVYWFGDIAYVQKDYPAAARAFAEEIKKYPDSTRAPDSMLKLGQSLIAMGQKQEGCSALAALPTKYPNASKTIVSRASQERKAGGCK
ncbi:MAG TPA: tol-pal system protein YbgF [Rhizomicrobium sp.]|jgi:tol-pal system protein YbgF|nr:tol-pal system protein YbgF [Rhizomicrobium sp.]